MSRDSLQGDCELLVDFGAAQPPPPYPMRAPMCRCEALRVTRRNGTAVVAAAALRMSMFRSPSLQRAFMCLLLTSPPPQLTGVLAAEGQACHFQAAVCDSNMQGREFTAAGKG